MGDIKLEELEMVHKKEKDYTIRIRMVAVRMVRGRNMPVEETADILVCCPAGVRNWLRRYDGGHFLQACRCLPCAHMTFSRPLTQNPWGMIPKGGGFFST